MSGDDGAEVARVQGRDLCDGESFGHGHDRGVCHAEGVVDVLPGKLRDAEEVGRRQLGDGFRAPAVGMLESGSSWTRLIASARSSVMFTLRTLFSSLKART